MEKKDSKLKSLNELKFDSVGDEYIYLFETLGKSEFAELLREDSLTIEYLRELYGDLIKNESLDVKYKDSKRYWFKEQEKAIVDYINCQDPEERNKIFNKHLYKPLTKLVENIIFTYKLFRSYSNIKDIQQECISFLITKIERFDPKTGAQAFSYLGTIAKHYLMGEQRNTYKFIKSNLDIDENIDEASEKPDYNYVIDGDEQIDFTFEMFNEIIKNFEHEIENKNTKLNKNDLKVAESIVILFKTHELIQYYNKNKIYFYLKEQTRLSTKEITSSLGKFRTYYKNIKITYLKNKNK